MIILSESYVCKKEVDWSLLMEGLTLPMEHQVAFGQIAGRFLKRGETKDINLFLDGKTYKAKIVNVNNSIEKRKNDAYQIRYTRNGELSRALQLYFSRSYNYIKAIREARDPSDRSVIKLPEGAKDYLTIYTTEYDDTYILETILSDDIAKVEKAVASQDERTIENIFNYDEADKTAGINISESLRKIRKLNRSIGDNLKLLYGYRCQICGKLIGEPYGMEIAETHHIEYFVRSMNNDANNQIILCPNHHSIIHAADPEFNRKSFSFRYPNGYEEGLAVNYHLT